MSGWNLPPGVTTAQIEAALGDDPAPCRCGADRIECPNCGGRFCVDEDLTDDSGICPDCGREW